MIQKLTCKQHAKNFLYHELDKNAYRWYILLPISHFWDKKYYIFSHDVVFCAVLFAVCHFRCWVAPRQTHQRRRSAFRLSHVLYIVYCRRN